MTPGIEKGPTGTSINHEQSDSGQQPEEPSDHEDLEVPLDADSDQISQTEAMHKAKQALQEFVAQVDQDIQEQLDSNPKVSVNRQTYRLEDSVFDNSRETARKLARAQKIVVALAKKINQINRRLEAAEQGTVGAKLLAKRLDTFNNAREILEDRITDWENVIKHTDTVEALNLE